MSALAALLLLATPVAGSVAPADNALETLAVEIARSLAVPSGTLAVSSAGGTPAAQLFVERLLGVMGAGGRRVVAVAAADDVAAARAAGALWLVRARLGLTSGEVVAWAELRALRANFWSGDVPAGAERVAVARAAADADLRALARAGAEYTFTARGQDDDPILACAIGDLDGDGRGEIALVKWKRVEVWRWPDDAHSEENAVGRARPEAELGLRTVRAVRAVQRHAAIAGGDLRIWGNDLDDGPNWEPPAPASARGDLDGDGLPEEIRTLAALEPPDRALVVKGGKSEEVVFQSPEKNELFNGICTGDLDGDGRAEALVLAWGAGFYLVKAR